MGGPYSARGRRSFAVRADAESSIRRVPRTLAKVRLPRFRKSAGTSDPLVSIGDPRLEGWATVSTFEDQATATAWRDQLRQLGVDASCAADHPLDRFGRGDIYLVVPPEQWSRANEIVENLED